ncbi:unnamed protein product, partial [Ilex paraguariensis]
APKFLNPKPIEQGQRTVAWKQLGGSIDGSVREMAAKPLGIPGPDDTMMPVGANPGVNNNVSSGDEAKGGALSIRGGDVGAREYGGAGTQ